MTKAQMWDQMQEVAKANGFDGCTDAITRARLAEAALANRPVGGEATVTFVGGAWVVGSDLEPTFGGCAVCEQSISRDWKRGHAETCPYYQGPLERGWTTIPVSKSAALATVAPPATPAAEPLAEEDHDLLMQAAGALTVATQNDDAAERFMRRFIPEYGGTLPATPALEAGGALTPGQTWAQLVGVKWERCDAFERRSFEASAAKVIASARAALTPPRGPVFEAGGEEGDETYEFTLLARIKDFAWDTTNIGPEPVRHEVIDLLQDVVNHVDRVRLTPPRGPDAGPAGEDQSGGVALDAREEGR